MSLKMASARFVCDMPEYVVTECEPPFRVRFLAQGLFQYLGHERGIFRRLLFWVDFAEDRTKFRMLIQDITKILIDESFVYARSWLLHGEQVSRLSHE
jgi:hypothetical protein